MEMADSKTGTIDKMKVIDLRKELKARGLPSTGDKAMLIARLQEAMVQDVKDEQAAMKYLSSDEIDSDGVLEGDDDDNADSNDDDFTEETLNEELALADHPPSPPVTNTELCDVDKPQRKLKRKLVVEDTAKDKQSDNNVEENKDVGAKKIVLNRVSSITTLPAAEQKVEPKTSNLDLLTSTNVTAKIPSTLDAKARLELRAKRFGLPVKMSDAERKEARKQRFGQNVTSKTSALTDSSVTANLEKLKKRADRFGQSVSKFMADIENKEKLERREAKFGLKK